MEQTSYGHKLFRLTPCGMGKPTSLRYLKKKKKKQSKAEKLARFSILLSFHFITESIYITYLGEQPLIFLLHK